MASHASFFRRALLVGILCFLTDLQTVRAVTMGTNIFGIFFVVGTPEDGRTIFTYITNQSLTLQTNLSDASGSASGFLQYTSSVTYAGTELVSLKMSATATAAAQGVRTEERGHGAGVDSLVWWNIPFFTSNTTTVEIRSRGEVRAFPSGFTNDISAAFRVDVFPEDLDYDRMFFVTNQVRTQRVTFPGGNWHRLQLFLGEVALADWGDDHLVIPGGTSSAEYEVFFQSTNEVRWISSTGGSYFRASNWDPPRVPEKSSERADIALFDLPVQYEVDSSAFAPASFQSFSGTQRATAERWVLQGGEVRNSGGATLSSLDPEVPSLSIGRGSRLNLQSGALNTVHTRVGDGGTGLSEVWIMSTNSTWTNSGSLFVGEYGPAQILAFGGRVKTTEARIGLGERGEVYVRGAGATFEADNVAVGYRSSAGKLSVETGGYAEVRGLYLGYEEGSRGEVVVTGKSGNRKSTLWSIGTNEIGRLGPAEVKVLDGGTLVVNEPLNISTFQASVTGARPGKVSVEGVNGEDQSYLLAANDVAIGGAGELKVLEGAAAEFQTGWIGYPGGASISVHGVHSPTRKRSTLSFQEGLILGWLNEAFTSVSVTNGAKLLAEGESQFGGLSEHFVAVHTEKDGFSAELDITDPILEVGGGVIVVQRGGLLRTKTTLLSGRDEIESVVVIDGDRDLPGWIAIGNIRVGGESGRAELHIGGDGVVSCTGTVSIHPGRGRISGPGLIRTLTLTNAGEVFPGSSPGTLTIDGAYVQTETGKLGLEINGTEEGRYDVLRVTGKADIAGKIEYYFSDYFTPKAGDKFPTLKVDGATSKTAQEIIAGTPLGIGNFQTRITNGVIEVTSVTPTNYNVLQQFGAASEGATNGWGKMILGTNGLIYGCLRNGGRANAGAIYSMRPEGYDFRILHHFGGTNDGAQPLGGVMQASDGRLYGTCSVGGTNNVGTIWAINLNGSRFEVLRHFGRNDDLTNPSAELIERADGRLAGTAAAGGFAGRGGVFTILKTGRGYNVMNDFSNDTFGQPSTPTGGLVEGPDGTVYGTTERGGTANNGTIFSMNRIGALGMVKSLGIVAGGAENPQGTLLLDEDGTLYGTSYSGGRSNFGTIFAIKANGNDFRVVRDLGIAAGEAREPRAGLVEAPDGTLLGTSRVGGGAAQGAVFRVQKDGTGYATLRIFNGLGGEGARPRSPLLQTAGGVFYGTTFGGGINDQGVLFRIFTPGLVPAPKFVGEAPSIMDRPGSTITLRAPVEGSAPLRYQWQRQGTNIPGAFSATLTLPQMDSSKVGEYKVRVTGLTGEITSGPIQASLFSIDAARNLTIEGGAGNRYRIETTDRLSANTTWTELTTVVLANGKATVPVQMNQGARFYRAALIP